MTTVVIYDEFKGTVVHLAGGGQEDQSVEVLAGATRQFKLEPGQSLMIDGDSENDEAAKARAPTISEYVAAGYDARKYPPAGYEAVSSQEEIDAAITAQHNTRAPTGLNNEQVPGSFTPIPGKAPWDVAGAPANPNDDGVRNEPFVPAPKPSFIEDPRNDEQKSKDAERADKDRELLAKSEANAAASPFGQVPAGGSVPYPDHPMTAPLTPDSTRDPETQEGHHPLPGQNTNENTAEKTE